ncbi:HelD family protein [Streptomyces sp. JNUCC 64]
MPRSDTAPDAPASVPAPPPASVPVPVPPALREERAHHDRCRAALAAMAADADEHVVTGADVSASGADAEVLGRALRTRARRMRELPGGPLFFGRIDFAAQSLPPGTEGETGEGAPGGPGGPGGPDGPDGPDGPGGHAGQRYHIGRGRISEDPTAPPLVVDWRAPVARAFYQATPDDPRGVAVRRRFGWAPGATGGSEELTALEDEHLDPSAAPGPVPSGTVPFGTVPSGPGPSGPGRSSPVPPGSGDPRGGEPHHGEPRGGDPRGGEPGAGEPDGLLAAELRRPRTGPMRDIAATIQPDQDDLVRAGPDESLCVQGAPGTGKTAVGLHRAAYLLYTHPRRISRAGLLVLGPNPTFLRYVAQVLPALGEDGIAQLTVADLVARRPARARDGAAAALVKHDVRMAEVLRRALYARVRPGAAVPDGLVVPDGAARLRVPADRLRDLVADVLDEEPPYGTGRERVRARTVALLREAAERRGGPRGEGWARRLERSRPVTAFLDAVWPQVVPEEVLAGLLGSPPELERAADGLLDPAERAALRWESPPRSYRSARWTDADLVLLDELSGLVAPPAGYGHVVLDEAQDLSPMECRAVARRVPRGALTVLGDLAQGTTPWAARSWSETLAHLGRPDARRTALTSGFRMPQAVAAFVGRLLSELDVDVPPLRSARRDGTLMVRQVPDTAVAVVAAVRAARAAGTGSLAVIAADAEVPRLRVALTAAGLPPEPDPTGPGPVLLPATVVKGLEFDHVVAVEPAAVREAEARGAHRLYVVLTRAVGRLEVLHERPLPFG